MSGHPYPMPYGGGERRSGCGDSECRAHTDKQFNEMKKIFTDYTVEAEDLLDQIYNKIEINNAKSESRHDETQSRLNHMIQSIEAFIHESQEFHSDVRKAFVARADGSKDYEGHRNAHENALKDAEEWAKFRRFIMYTVAGTVIAGILPWMWFVLWPAIVAGPK